MISKLYIENIAVIEKAEIDFDKGFNVLTGETGAGKSILIDSINAVLGQRTSRELIRTGAQKAFVSAQFDNISESALNELNKIGISIGDDEDNCLILQREIKADGRGSVKINDRPATISTLRNVGHLLINIHGQHENQALMSVEKHMKYLDMMGGYSDKLNEYSAVYQEYVSALHRLNKTRIDDAEIARRTDMLKFQIEELENAELVEGETDALKKKRDIIMNAERIASTLGNAYGMLNGGEEYDGVISMLEQCSDSLEDISELYPECGGIAERITNLIYELEDVSAEVRSLNEDNEFSPYELNDIENRLELLNRIHRKYGDERQALEFLEIARKELDALERADELLEKLTQNVNKLHKKAAKLAAELTELRKDAAVKFCESVGKELAFLDMPRVKIEVSIEPCELNANGADNVEFLISANPGEPPKPLGKIASGGELSRIMLAIKTVLADIDDIDTMIFDEVDTGISGRAAHKVGLKLHEVSRTRQIICITHLAQMAAQADIHMLISKNVEGDRTFTSVQPLDFEHRKQELARINGGDVITDSMLNTAEEMLNNAGLFA